MKMNRKLLTVLAATMMILVGCNKNEEVHDFSKTIGLLFFEPINDWRLSTVNYGVDKATQLGYDYDLKLSANAQQQEASLNDLMKKGIKTVVITDQGLKGDVVNKVIAQGVNVVLFDAEIDCNYSCYISPSHEDMGKLAGEYLKGKSGNKVVIFDIVGASSVSTPRVAAFKAALGSGKEIVTINIDAFTPEAGRKVVDQVIAANPDAMWAQDDMILMGMLDELEGKVPNLDCIVAGGGYQPFLQIMKNNDTEFELVSMTFSPQIIEDAISIAGNLTKGIQPSSKRMIVNSKLITEQNVDQFIKQGVKF